MSKHQTSSHATSSRRQFLASGFCAAASCGCAPSAWSVLTSAPARSLPETSEASPSGFEFEEFTVADLQKKMSAGELSSRAITESYLSRIDQIDKHGPTINSVIELNPDALDLATRLDEERGRQGVRGPLHGIPVLIKDNIDTADRMQTTAGSLALEGSKPAEDAFVVGQLRRAGAVILGKTNLSEWANIRSSHSISGWSGRGGQTRNPYVLDRNPCGSSSGSGASVSANLCALAVGTETDGSVVCPSSANGIVGIKPTLGLVSRAGIIPIAHSQDTAGAMARSVRDAAVLLGALAGVDPRDPATAQARGRLVPDYTQFLDPEGLRGARIGVARKYFGFHDGVDELMNLVLEEMKHAGAVLIDPADLDSHGKFDDSEIMVMLYELKADLNAYLAARPGAPKSLQAIIEFNELHRASEMPYFGQDLFLKAERSGPLSTPEYRDALSRNQRLSRSEGIDAVMDRFHLDAIVAPTSGPAWLNDPVDGDRAAGGSSNAAAVAGYPDITVPAGFLFHLPVGISFFGRAWSEPKLLKIAYGFEQVVRARRAPQFLPSLEHP